MSQTTGRDGDVNERRQFPRRKLENEFTKVRSLSKVQVLEISIAGVLLRTSRSFAAGATGTLRLNLGGLPFTASLQIRRVASDSTLGHLLGAAFLGLTPENVQLLTRFVTH
jgi:hypothetical protein